MSKLHFFSNKTALNPAVFFNVNSAFFATFRFSPQDHAQHCIAAAATLRDFR
jgi:hypothetical protein